MSVLQAASREFSVSVAAAAPMLTVSCQRHCHTPRYPVPPGINIHQYIHAIPLSILTAVWKMDLS